MANTGTVHERMELEEDTIVEAEMEVIGILTPDGQVQMKIRVEGEASYTTCLGLLEQAKMTLLAEWLSDAQD